MLFRSGVADVVSDAAVKAGGSKSKRKGGFLIVLGIGAALGAIAAIVLSRRPKDDPWAAPLGEVTYLPPSPERASTWQDKAKDAAEAAGDKTKDAAEAVSDKAKDLADKARDTAYQAKHKVADVADDVADKAEDVADDVSDGVTNAADELKDTADKTLD